MIDAALEIVPAAQICVVTGHMADEVEAAVRSIGVRFVRQMEQLGTGHALQCVKAAFAADSVIPPSDLLVLSGDVPLIRRRRPL